MEGDRQGYAVTLDFHMASRPYPIMYVHTSPHPHGHTCHPHRDGHQVVVAKPLAAVIGTIACAPAAAISTGHCAVKAVIRFARVGVQVGVRPEGALAIKTHAARGVAGELKRLHARHLHKRMGWGEGTGGECHQAQARRQPETLSQTGTKQPTALNPKQPTSLNPKQP